MAKSKPYMPAGWVPAHWVERLRRLADACEPYRPDLAAEHRANADAIEAELGLAQESVEERKR